MGSLRQPVAHGTYLGYKSHVRHQEKACDECREAWRVHRLAKEREKGVKPRVKKKLTDDDIEHGTDRGYGRHRQLKVPTCKACRAAHAEVERQRKAAKTPEQRQAALDKEKETRAKNLRYGRVQVPLEIFVNLWFTADQNTLEQMDNHFGRERIDNWIKKNEEAQSGSDD